MKVLLLAAFFLTSVVLFGQQPTVERWNRYEVTLTGPPDGNPFKDIWLTAEFTHGQEKIKVNGFYDGAGAYKIRFMPDQPGEWRYVTNSNNKRLSGKTGSFQCVPATAGNHGPVTVANTWHFKYADGQWYYPFGTTLYAWTHQGDALQEQTLQTLQHAGQPATASADSTKQAGTNKKS